MARICAALTVLAALAAALPATAAATFPGRNGDLVYASQLAGTHGADSVSELYRLPARGRPTAFWTCAADRGPQVPFCLHIAGVAASPDGRRLAALTTSYANGETFQTVQIISLDSAPTVELPLPRVDVETTHEHLAWTPDGDALGVVRTHRGQGSELLVLGLDGRELERVAGVTDADWSAGGALAYIAGDNLHVRRPDGTTRRLTWRQAASPSFSPDGRWIAFNRGCDSYGRGPACGVFVVRTTGGRARKVASHGSDPAWAPNGREIAYVLQPKEHRLFDRGDVVVYKTGIRRHRKGLVGVNPRQVTSGARGTIDLYYGQADLQWLTAPRQAR